MVKNFTSSVHLCFADQPLIECIERMAREKIGALLVVEKQDSSNILGIFTERDLLAHCVGIQKKNMWEKSIQLFMTRKVVTIPSSKIHLAPQVMLEKGFRHLPVVNKDPETHQDILVGVLSIRDFLKDYAHHTEARHIDDLLGRLTAQETTGALTRLKLSSINTVGILSSDYGFRHLAKEVFFDRHGIQIKKITPFSLFPPSGGVQALNGLDLIFLDFDELDIQFWSPILKLAQDHNWSRKIIYIFTPGKYQQNVIDIFNRATASNLIKIFEKPIDLLKFYREMKEILEPKSTG